MTAATINPAHPAHDRAVLVFPEPLLAQADDSAEACIKARCKLSKLAWYDKGGNLALCKAAA